MFFRLALYNMKKNLNRSLLAVAVMVVASAILTGSWAMPVGYTEVAFLGYRQAVGADIIIYPGQLLYQRQPGNQTLRMTVPVGAFGNSLDFFHRELRSGYLTRDGATAAVDYQAVSDACRTVGGIEAIIPYLSMPAWVVIPDPRINGNREYRVILRGRRLDIDYAKYQFGSLLSKAIPIEDGRVPLYRNENGIEFSPPPALGDDLRLELPVVRGIYEGRPIYDFSQTVTVTAAYGGIYSISLGVDTARDEDGRPITDESGRSVQVEIFWREPEVIVPEEAWREWAHLAGLPEGHYTQIGLVVESMFDAQQIAAALGQALPEYTVVTVPQEALYQKQSHVRETGQVPVPDNLRHLLLGLTYLIAGILVATNMFVLVNQRQKDLGILKAIGVGTREIFVMVLTETMAICWIGSLVGFALMWLLNIYLYLFTKLSLAEIGAFSLLGLVRVLAVTTTVSLFFGSLPALKAARATVVEALRTE